VIGTILADAALSERQKSVLVEIYESFRRENDATRRNDATGADTGHQPDSPHQPSAPAAS
jgi:hypothetical protein